MTENDKRDLIQIAKYKKHTYKLTELDGAVLARVIIELQNTNQTERTISMDLASLKSAIPPDHHVSLDAAMASALAIAAPQANAAIFDIIKQLLALLKSLGITNIPWMQIIQLIPLIAAALANPALWPQVIAAILALLHPPSPTPVP